MADTGTTTSHYPQAATIDFTTGTAFDWKGTDVSDKLSIINIYKVLASYVSAYEAQLADSVKSIQGSNATDIDQGTLLELQAMVQTWGTIAATATGIVRSVGDVLTKITQNIR